MLYKAIFLDLDGTLLDDEKNISKENIEAICKAKEKGVYVILSSGRQKDAVENYKKMANSSRYIICSNGTQIYDCDDNQTIFMSSLEKDICDILLNYVIKNDYYIRIEDKYCRYINSKEYFVKHEVVLDNEEMMKKLKETDNILQITIGSKSKEDMEKIINYISGLNIKDIKIENFYSGIFFGKEIWSINIINSNASKGNAIQGLCKFLKINIENTIAMGDDKNDLSMIKTVGLGIAMGNAEEIVKENAKEITKTNNENGVAEIINSKILV